MKTETEAVIYATTATTDIVELNRSLAAAHNEAIGRNYRVTGAYVDIGGVEAFPGSGLDRLLHDQETRRAPPLVLVPSLTTLASDSGDPMRIIRRIRTTGATLCGPGFDASQKEDL
jgi:hypothetical protein